jgi:UTP--glucose-1-phosphate uridylyltransferase
MTEVYAALETSVIAVKQMPMEDISRYGVVAPVESDIPPQLDRSMRSESRIVMFDGVVEKPAPEDAPSDLAIIGRYLLTPDIFDDLDVISPGANGELQLTDALALQAKRRTSSALLSPIGRRDIGHPLGWVQAVIDEALHHPRIGSAVRAWLIEKLRDDNRSR